MFKSATDAAILAGRVTPADVQRFSAVVPPEARTAEAWARYSAGIAPPRLGPARRTLVDDGGGSVTGEGTAAEQLDKLVAAEVELQRAKFNRIVQPIDVVVSVWRKHPELTKEWLNEPSTW